MSEFGGFKECTDATDVNDGRKPEISSEARSKFDKLMEDDNLDNKNDLTEGEQLQSGQGISGEEKFKSLFESESVAESVAESDKTNENSDSVTDAPPDATEAESTADTKENKFHELTDEDRVRIKEETDWSDEIIDHIETWEQYEIYKNAELHEGEVNGRKCLLKDIDMDYVDPKTISDKHPEGLSNRELMAKGRSPYDSKTGERIELHHIGQDFNSPFAELAENSEHGDGNDAILHDKSAESWRQDAEKNKQYNNVHRPNHWKTRAAEV